MHNYDHHLTPVLIEIFSKMCYNLLNLFIFRVWNKIKHEKKIVYPDERCLNEISNMFNGSNCINLSHLHDSEVN